MGRGGNDLHDGGAGFDTAFSRMRLRAIAYQINGSDILVTGASEGTDTVLDTVEQFQFAGQTLTRAQLIAALTPPTFTDNADTVTLPFLGGTFNALGGDDRLSYTGGFVTINGGAGTDTVDFSQFGSAVWVSLDLSNPEIWTTDSADLVSGHLAGARRSVERRELGWHCPFRTSCKATASATTRFGYGPAASTRSMAARERTRSTSRSLARRCGWTLPMRGGKLGRATERS